MSCYSFRDPFLGSGTTALAAIAEGFRCAGIELEPASYATAKARIQSTTPQQRQLFKP